MDGQVTAISASVPREIFARLFRKRRASMRLHLFPRAEESLLARRRRHESAVMGPASRSAEVWLRCSKLAISDQPELYLNVHS
jgi:hypothetical protein